MGILRTDRVSGLGGANAIKGSVYFPYVTSGGYFHQYQQIQSDDYAFGTGAFTLECWYYMDGDGGHTDSVGNIILLTGTNSLASTAKNGVWLASRNDNKFEARVYYASGSWNMTMTSTNAFTRNTWHHLAMVRSGSSVKLYVNGVQEASGSSSSDLDTTVSTSLYIGAQGNATSTSSLGSRGITGYVSNVRVSNEALYTAAFTAPVGELQKLSSTITLCNQSPSDVLKEETGKTITLYRKTLNHQLPLATRFTPNSPVGFSTTTDVGTQFGSTFDGVTTFDSQAYMVPPGGNTRERNRGRGLIMGGAVSPGATNTTQIKYFDIAAGGITEDFGQTTVARRSTGSLASSTRAVMGGGFVSPPAPYTISDVIDFVTIANTANAVDFGNMQSTGYAYGTASNETRGLFAGGYRPNNSAVVNTIDLITIATAGNASNFGDLTRQVRSFGGFSSSTRGVFAGGTYPAVQDVIDFVTFSTTGDATDFGNLTDARDNVYGASSSTRGVMAGGRDPNTTNIIDFITIASAGNAIDFGDLTQTSYYFNSATANSTRAVWAGNSSISNAMEFVTIATTGNATDFGDQNGTAQHSNGAASDSHRGIS